MVAELFHRCAMGYGAGRAQRMMRVKFRGPQVPTQEEFREAVVENNFVATRFAVAQFEAPCRFLRNSSAGLPRVPVSCMTPVRSNKGSIVRRNGTRRNSSPATAS